MTALSQDELKTLVGQAAVAYVQAGGGWLMPQADLTAEALASRLQALTRHDLLMAAQKVDAQKKTNATREVVMACEELAA